METSVDTAVFEDGYRKGDPPWVIGQPQPALVELERAGQVSGTVLDIGCGTGDNAVHLAALGYDVVGIDASPTALQRARATAAARGVEVRFEQADALDLSAQAVYDTVLDSALFHIFGTADQLRYTRSLHRAVRGRVHLLALADAEPQIGPRVSAAEIRAAFADGWQLTRLERAHYRGVARGDSAAAFGVAEGEIVDAPAWSATAVRR
ncbi:class I SAM-dependent methyltransferase [Saccharopolyspora sp. HNM0983]|uniref:Class I SAM-dependent methyltransferase n=1 Tax=Saccharopolyspora montiporae TaxID=2781240 RepID=A0A929BEH8_9PSEU|nr:class I SAM-dependent methyltransferase [Saccharopolyspora sp. HNM0983]MBE9376571.1 class I SAM-dependent methyltransferase [Saccharopolyspora sp. HNM0983]